MYKKYSLVLFAFLTLGFNIFGLATLPVARTVLDSKRPNQANSLLKTETSATTCSNNNGTKFQTIGDLNDGSRFMRWRFTKNYSNLTMEDVNIMELLPDPNLAITGTPTDQGSICIGSISTPITYTITNSGTIAAVGVTVVSDNAQFVISGLSSTTISGSGGTATYNVTFNPVSAGLKTTTLTVANTTGGSNSLSINLTGTGIFYIAPALVSNTANTITATGAQLRATSSTLGSCPPTIEKGFVYAVNAVNPNPQNSGTGVTILPNATLGGSGSFYQNISSLSEGTTYSYQAYLYDGTIYTYGGVQKFTTIFSGTLNNVTNTKACLTDEGGSLTWTAPTLGLIPTGYMVFAIEGSTTPDGTLTTALTDYANANSDYSATTNTATPTSLGRLLYKGNANTIALTGFTENINYSFLVLSFQDGTSLRRFSNGAAGGRDLNVIAQDDVKTLTGIPSNNQVTLNWTYNAASSCFNDVLIIANQGTVVFNPTGDGSSYTANSVYSTPNQVVYKGTANSRTITGLTNGTEYCFKIFIRRGTTWSDGITICATPDIVYCNSQGSTTDNIGITSVQFNTISQMSTGANAYTDYTAVSTTVLLDGNYALSVQTNTDGPFTIYSKVWFDWNHNGSFNDAGEAYTLGTAINVASGLTNNSPLTITVPTNASIGNTRMRVSVKSISGQTYPTSCETFALGEVEDYTIIIAQPLNAEINVKGGVAQISIPNGFDEPFGLNNTLFAGTPLNTDSIEKQFTIENIGVAALNLAGAPIIQIAGSNPGDFVVTQQAATPVAHGTPTTFKIKFRPTVAGLREADVSISSNDSDEDPYIFRIQGNGQCTAAPSITMFPLSGPSNTIVKFTSIVNDLTGAAVSFNNSSIPIISNETGAITVAIPTEANDGNFEVLLNSGCSITQFFDVIDSVITDCVNNGDSATLATDLFIYEVYDEKVGLGGVITLYNRTGATLDLSSYSIQRASDYGGSYITYANLIGTLANNSVSIVSVSSSNCGYIPTGNGSFGATGFNKNDGFRLRKAGVVIDDVRAPNHVGYYRKRKNTNLNPNAVFNAIEWTTQSISAGQCLTGIGQVPLLKTPPAIVTQPSYISDCRVESAILSVLATEGVSDSTPLAYQWYVIGTTGNWTAVSNTEVYSGATTETLTISNISGLGNYQYYCQVKENTETCYTASNTIQIKFTKTVWNGSAWNPNTPDINTVTEIDNNFDTSGVGQDSFSACRLIVNPNCTLTISANKYVEVQNNVTVNGNIIVNDKGSFVQNNDLGAVNGAVLSIPSKIVVQKMTALINNWYEYTYWGSPVSGETAGTAFAESNANRRFWYNGANFLDSTKETGNNNAVEPGQDDVDDDGNDWTLAPPSMTLLPGVGYASTLSSSVFAGPNTRYQFTFEGPFNNGIVTVPIYRNDSQMADNNWNLIGNPYPSAISADAFLLANAVIDMNVLSGAISGAIFLWSQNTMPSETNNGNENLNFAQSDYAIINNTGEVAGGDGIKPTRFIASGQGFFISMANNATALGGTIKTSDITFSNAMRVTGDNEQFFKTSEFGTLENKIWINLTSNNGVFNQVLVGYVNGATDDDDGMYYDASKNLSSGANSIIYTLVNSETNLKLAIQGKCPASLDVDEVIPLGFYTSINQATTYNLSIADLKGDFMTANTIFLVDNLTGDIHNLNLSNYSFTSQTGEFNTRFEIRFKDPSLSIIESEMNPIELTIVELNDGRLKFSVGRNLNIKAVQILDILGRTLYNLKGNSPTEIYDLPNLSQATYMAKVIFSNGQVLTKRAIKKF